MITVDGGVSITKIKDCLYRINDPIVAYDGKVIVVRAGFVSDGATIPRFLWAAIGSPWTGNYTRGAIVHDWLYGSHTYYNGELITRARSDYILREIARHDGTNVITSYILWAGVRLFGGLAWHKKRKIHLLNLCKSYT